MPLTNGLRLGPYEILAPIGAGGMGEVYKARDTRLDRTVAIKVLPSQFASNADLRQRFEREARAVSSLNHPNICTLHDIGHQDGMDYLVMEHLEGETLATRLGRGPLPVDELLRCAYDVADALDRAHRSGLMHRDLKPGNIMISKTGTKLLDFGLAKSIGSASAPSNLTASPTMTSPLTAEGSIMGTFQYMAPEQLEGREADPRSDLFALGVVIYEMATGRRAFEGRTQASLIASILKDQRRPISEMAPMNPPALERVVSQCLAKDPDDRWQSAGDLKRELKWIAGAGSQAGAAAIAATPVTARSRRAGWIPWAAAVLLAAAALPTGYSLRAPEPMPVMRSSLTLPPDTTLASQDTSLVLSPDGTRLAMILTGADGKRHIWARPIDSLTAQALAGTEGATYPFWSPDGQQIGFFADRKLRKVPAAGGTVVSICEAEDGRGATWSRAGLIVFSPGQYGPLMQVPSSGGAPLPATTVENEVVSHRVPHFMPDGKHVLFYSYGSGQEETGSGIYALDVDSKQVSLVAKERSEGLYVEPGYLVFVRDENLMAQPFDAGSLRTTGEAVPIAEKVRFNPFRFTGAFTFSPTGLLVYQAGGAVPRSQLTWFDIDGKKGDAVGEPANFLGSGRSLSPDDRRAAVIIDSADRKADIWIYDLARGVGTRFTFGTAPIGSAVWSPDGKQIAYAEGQGKMVIKASDGASDARVLLSEAGNSRLIPASFSPDGSVLAFRKQSTKTRFDIWLISLQGDPNPRPFITTQGSEFSGEFSPDGNWFSYTSDESGREELFVTPYPGPAAKRQISTAGGSFATWIGDGSEIMYVTPKRTLVAVPLTANGSNLEIGTSRKLFGGQPLPLSRGGSITRDGRRLLAAVPLDAEVTPPLTLVTNWPAALSRR